MKLKHFTLLLFTPLLLSACHSTTVLQQVKGNKVILSPCVLTWSSVTDPQKEKHLGEFEGCDILTSRTMRDVKDNNDKLHKLP